MTNEPAARRNFLAKMSAGALSLIAGTATAARANPRPSHDGGLLAADEKWLEGLNGKHKAYYDATSVNDGFALGYALNLLDTYDQAYGTKDSDVNVIVGFRHFSIPLAFNDSLWAKYKFGEFAKINDPATKQPAVRNIYMHSKPGDLMLPGMAIEKLQARGVRFVVCNVALTLLSGMMGKSAGLTPEAAKKEWTAAMHPGFMIVPSGVLAVNRAQEAGCKYCSAG